MNPRQCFPEPLRRHPEGMSGQIAGMLRELRPCEDILKGMTAEAEELLKNAYKRFE